MSVNLRSSGQNFGVFNVYLLPQAGGKGVAERALGGHNPKPKLTYSQLVISSIMKKSPFNE